MSSALTICPADKSPRVASCPGRCRSPAQSSWPGAASKPCGGCGEIGLKGVVHVGAKENRKGKRWGCQGPFCRGHPSRARGQQTPSWRGSRAEAPQLTLGPSSDSLRNQARSGDSSAPAPAFPAPARRPHAGRLRDTRAPAWESGHAGGGAWLGARRGGAGPGAWPGAGPGAGAARAAAAARPRGSRGWCAVRAQG